MKRTSQKCLLAFMAIALLCLTGCLQYGETKASDNINTGIMRLYVDTNNVPIVSKETKVPAAMKLVGPYGNEIISVESIEDGATIKGRGNSTWDNYPKKPYNLDFGNLGKVKSDKVFTDFTNGTQSKKIKKYSLLANYLDPTMLRNDLAMAMAGNKIAKNDTEYMMAMAGNKIAKNDTEYMMAMPWTTNHEFVDLYLNGNYNGTYLMTDNRKNIEKYIAFDKSQDACGYFVEYDQYYDEDPKFRTDHDLPAMIQWPEYDDIPSGTEESYSTITFPSIKSDINTLEAELYAGITANIDLDSFAKFWIVYNLTGNPEPSFPRSTFLYRENRTAQLHLSPVWDFDAYTFINPTDEIYLTKQWYFEPLMANADFKTILKNCWYQLMRDGYISDSSTATTASSDYKMCTEINEYLDDRSITITKAWNLNKQSWDTGNNWYNEQFQTFEGYVYGLKTAVRQRAETINTYMATL